jgi:hypothetical protein
VKKELAFAEIENLLSERLTVKSEACLDGILPFRSKLQFESKSPSGFTLITTLFSSEADGSSGLYRFPAKMNPPSFAAVTYS